MTRGVRSRGRRRPLSAFPRDAPSLPTGAPALRPLKWEGAGEEEGPVRLLCPGFGARGEPPSPFVSSADRSCLPVLGRSQAPGGTDHRVPCAQTSGSLAVLLASSPLHFPTLRPAFPPLGSHMHPELYARQLLSQALLQGDPA